MLIEADQVAYGLRQTISRNDSELQPDMEGVATKRRRCTSSTSCNSAATQLSYISEDSGSPLEYPNEGQGSRPLFRLESQEDESQALYTFRQSNGDVSSGNRLAKAASASSATSSSNHRALPPGALTNRTAFPVGVPANGTRTLLKPPPKATSDNRLYYEKQRALIKAKRLGADRRRSESIVTHRSRESLVPPHRSHTTTCMAQGGSMLEEDDETFQKQAFCGNCTAAVVGSRSSLTNLLHVNERNRCNHNRDANVNASRMRVDGRVLGYHQMNCSPVRAKSIDGLDDSVHFYDSLGPSSTNINERDTEIYMDHNEPGVRLSRTRLNSAPSDDSTERIQNEARLNNDAESGYVRNGPREHSGFFGTVSITLRRHGIAVLAMCYVLLLVVICIGISYAFLIKPPPKIVALGSDAGNCFNCTDMPFGTTKEHLESGLLHKHDKDQCCFRSSEDMNSWFIKDRIFEAILIIRIFGSLTVIDRVLDECCFKDKFHVLVTFKFYADVKLSEYQSELSSLKDSVNKLYSMVYTMTEEEQGEKPNVILPMSPIMKETIASLTQKKRSILYLKSNRIRQTRHGSRIEWSDEPVTSPLPQGNLGLLSGDSTHIEIAETGVYTIRAEVKFVSNDEIETGLTLLEYHVKARSFNGHLTPIESFTEQIRFSQERSEFHGIVHTVAQLNQGDAVLVHLPRPRGGAIVSETVGAHRITVIEET